MSAMFSSYFSLKCTNKRWQIYVELQYHPMIIVPHLWGTMITAMGHYNHVTR